MGVSAASPYKRYYRIFYKGLGLAHWAYDRENFVVSVGFNRGTLAYERGHWTKVKPGGYPGVFVGSERAEGRELWSADGYDVHVIPWDRLLKRRSRMARRTERISDLAVVNDLCFIDNVGFAVDDAGGVFRRTAPVSSIEATWERVTSLKPRASLVAIDGRSVDDLWVAGEGSVWHSQKGGAWKRVRMPKCDDAVDIVCGPKDAYVCGGETLVRIGPGDKLTRFDAEGCGFYSAAFYKGSLYLSSTDADDDKHGIWTLTRRGLEQVSTGFPPGWEYQPCGRLEVRAGLLWSFGNFGVYVFDGKRWEQLPNPQVPA